LFVPGTTNPQPPKSIKLQGRENHLEPTELGIGEDSNTYGSGIATGEDRLTLLKLSVMDPNELRDLDHPVRHPRIQQALDKNKNHGSEIDALGEYIKRLWTDGSRLVKDDLLDFGDFRPEDVKTRFVLGVPAIWGQESINRMEEAIITSGILAFGGGEDAKLDFVLEPVAAAMATIPGVARDKRPKVRVPSPAVYQVFSRKMWRALPCNGSLENTLTHLPGWRQGPHPRLRRRNCRKSFPLPLCLFALRGRPLLLLIR
jgi:hypothetical protein